MEIREAKNLEEQRQLAELKKGALNKTPQINDNKETNNIKILLSEDQISWDKVIFLLLEQSYKKIGAPTIATGFLLSTLLLENFRLHAPKLSKWVQPVTQGITSTFYKKSTEGSTDAFVNEIQLLMNESKKAQQTLLQEQTITKKILQEELQRNNQMLNKIGALTIAMSQERRSIQLGVKMGVQMAGPSIFEINKFHQPLQLPPNLINLATPPQNPLDSSGGSIKPSAPPISWSTGSVTKAPDPCLNIITKPLIQCRPVVEVYLDYQIPIWKVEHIESLLKVQNSEGR